jgi:hypothetical protein
MYLRCVDRFARHRIARCYQRIVNAGTRTIGCLFGPVQFIALIAACQISRQNVAQLRPAWMSAEAARCVPGYAIVAMA